MSDEHEYELLLPFDTDDEQFVRGFEAGRVWAHLQDNYDPYEATVHATNAEMMLRLAEATGRTVHSEELNEHWLNVVFSEAAS